MELHVSGKGNLFVRFVRPGEEEETVLCLEPISKSIYDKLAIGEIIKAEAKAKEEDAKNADSVLPGQ